MKSSLFASKKNYDGIDLFKFIGAFLVISIHTEIFSSLSTIFNYYFINVLSRLAVYFYFIATSYFFFKGISFENGKIKKCKENFSKLKKYFIRIFLLYFIWSFIYMISDLPTWYKYECLNIKNFLGFGLNCILDSSHYHLWFLISLVYAIPIMYFVLRFVKLKTFAIISVIFYIIGLIYGTYSFTNPPLADIWNLFGDIFIRLRTVLFYVIPICTFAIYSDKIKLSKAKINISTVLAIILYSAEQMILYFSFPNTTSSYSIFTIPATLFIFVFAKNLNLELKYSYILRKLSTLIYCSHPLVMTLLALMYEFKSLNSILYFVIVSISTLAFCSIIVFLHSKFKKLKFLKYIM